MADFVRKNPQFFEMYENDKRVRIKVITSKSGYQWRMCPKRHFTGKCKRGDACYFWHGPGDKRDTPLRKQGTTPSTSAMTSGQPSTSQNNLVPVVPRVCEGKNCYLVPQEKQCVEILAEITSQEVIAVDCEGVGLGTNGKLCLIQIATNSNVYVIDLCVDEKERSSIISALKPVFKSNALKKILHSAKNDNEALSAVGIINENFEDTQILYQDLIKLRGSAEKKLGLESLMKQYGFVHELKKKMKRVYYYKPDVWAQRPMTHEMIQYACLDVANLVTVYKKLKEDIEHAKANPVLEAPKIVENTYAAAVGLPVGSELRLFFTHEKKPDRKLPTDVAEGTIRSY